jgi:predicted nucleic acid-binding protein
VFFVSFVVDPFSSALMAFFLVQGCPHVGEVERDKRGVILRVIEVCLSAFFPDESQAQAVLREHVAGRLHLKAPALLPYELSNVVWQAERRGRITPAQADEIMQALAGLEIEIVSQEWGEMLPLARRFGRSAYDAAYLALAEKAGEPLITGDERLFNAVHAELRWVVWIGEYPRLP